MLVGDESQKLKLLPLHQGRQGDHSLLLGIVFSLAI